jgi:hypothetical protein
MCGPDVMAAQLEHLTEAATELLPYVTLRVIPYEVGAHPGMTASFAVLQFESKPPTGDVIHHESQTDDLFLENETDVRLFTAIFEHLRAMALPPEQSAKLLLRIARGMRGSAEA